MKESLSIILPAYNERRTICRLIQKILEILSNIKIDFEICIVDDSSTDGTAQMVQKAFADRSNVKVLSRTTPRSLGESIRDGIQIAVKDWVLIMDSDFKHPPEDIPRFLTSRDLADVVNGSRFLRGGGMKKKGLRYWGSRLLNFFFRKMLGLRVTDLLSGFILARRKCLQILPLDKIFIGHGDFGIRFHYALKQREIPEVEIPVLYSQRLGGPSKTHIFKHACQYLMAALRTRFMKF